MGTKRCINCMEEIDGKALFCTKCGYDQSGAEQLPYGIKPGTILKGRYFVGRILGQGGFGITYVGYDFILDIKVAIKEYFPMGFALRNHTVSNQIQWSTAQMDREQWRQGSENFLKEARRMAKLDSLPGIVRVRDTFPDNQTSYIVMDFLEGVTLKKKLTETGIMEIGSCIELLRPLMQSLGKMHQKGMIHRDISPDNIMIAPDGSACLLDFGAAKDVSMQQNAASQQVTKRGFSPPEQYLEKGSIGPWTDVYALCATVYYCVTGKMIPDAMERMCDDTLRFDETVRTLTGDHRAAVLADGLRLRSNERIQTVEELLQRFDMVQPVPSQPVPAVQEPFRTGEENKKGQDKKKIGIIAAASAAVVAVVCMLAVAAFGGGGDSKKDKEISRIEDESGVITGGRENETDIVDRPSDIVITQMGTSNANLANYGAYALVPQKYLYYLTGDNALYLCTYDEADQTFYMYDAERISDFGAFITMDDNSAYYLTTDYWSSSIVRINHDGSGLEYLYSLEDGRKMQNLQYVRLSDQREYLYFMQDNDKDDELAFQSLYRYGLEDKKVEKVVEGKLLWCNLYKDSIYYIDYKQESDSGGPVCSLEKADVDGQNAQVLNTDKKFLSGFVEDDNMYLYSLSEEAVLVYGLDGTPDSSFGGFYNIDINTDCSFGYGDGWIYYTNTGDDSIHRVRSNGTGDLVVAEGHTALMVCYANDGLWFVENQPTGREHQYLTQANYAYKTGETLFELGEADLGWGLGSSYLQDFEYQDTEDGAGVVITKYTGSETQFEILDEIGGKPVVAIGESAFAGTSVEEVGLPDHLVSIDNNAFFGCANLTFVGFPDGLTQIGDTAFGTCGSMETIDLPESLETIGDLAFAETSLSAVRIPANVTEIGAGAFVLTSSSRLTEFEVSSENEEYIVQDGALFLKGGVVLLAFPTGYAGSYTIPDGTMGIQSYAFGHCRQLTELVIPGSVELIGEDAFYDAGFNEISISNNCTLKGDWENSGITINRY